MAAAQCGLGETRRRRFEDRHRYRSAAELDKELITQITADTSGERLCDSGQTQS